MKQLLIMRHAKARLEGEDDLSRPLAPRGEKAAPVMGRCLKLAEAVPERILTSPAVRAHRTAQLVAAGCGFQGEIQVIERVYEASVEALVGILREIDEPAGRVLLVGHNPTLERLVWALCQPSPEAIPWSGLRMATGTVTLVELACDLWERLESGSGQIEWSLHPRLVVSINPKLGSRD